MPRRRDQVANRLRKGSAGGRPPAFDAQHYRRRKQVERGCNRRKQFRALATRYPPMSVRISATDWLDGRTTTDGAVVITRVRRCRHQPRRLVRTGRPGRVTGVRRSFETPIANRIS
jgi:transposase